MSFLLPFALAEGPAAIAGIVSAASPALEAAGSILSGIGGFISTGLAFQGAVDVIDAAPAALEWIGEKTGIVDKPLPTDNIDINAIRKKVADGSGTPTDYKTIRVKA